MEVEILLHWPQGRCCILSQADVCILGGGLIGSALADVIASRGFNCSIYEVDNSRRRALAEKFKGRESKISIAAVVERSRIFLICVNTGFENGVVQMSSVWVAVSLIAPFLDHQCIVIVVSTCPVGSLGRVAADLLRHRPDLDNPSMSDGALAFCLAASPERGVPENLGEELGQMPRLVGALDEESASKAADALSNLLGCECLIADARIVEAAKLFENVYRDVNIALANELQKISERLRFNAARAFELANTHKRVLLHRPGIGVGGECLTIASNYLQAGVEKSKLIELARWSNEVRPTEVADQIIAFARACSFSRVAFAGCSYKPNASDFRNSPALEIIAQFGRALVCDFCVVEPRYQGDRTKLAFDLIDDLALCNRCDCIFFLVMHSEFEAFFETQATAKEFQFWSIDGVRCALSLR